MPRSTPAGDIVCIPRQSAAPSRNAGRVLALVREDEQRERVAELPRRPMDPVRRERGEADRSRVDATDRDLALLAQEPSPVAPRPAPDLDALARGEARGDPLEAGDDPALSAGQRRQAQADVASTERLAGAV